ncbi:hypothetical protein JXM67_02695 [candidate division WOR-3 bacterium]|nr:hypothetical protein [candidate division WOR-3 bacterium]
MDEFNGQHWILDNIENLHAYKVLAGKEYLRVFKDARKLKKSDQLLNDLRGAIPEGLVYHLLNGRSESVGKTKREVYVEITTDRGFWSSKRGRRKTLDVAFWDSVNNLGRGFECKIDKVSKDKCSAIVELLSTIHAMTEGQFEMVLFSFCLDSDTLRETLSRNISEEDKTKLSTIHFIGTNHLPIFDGTTSCCGGSSLIPTN